MMNRNRCRVRRALAGSVVVLRIATGTASDDQTELAQGGAEVAASGGAAREGRHPGRDSVGQEGEIG